MIDFNTLASAAQYISTCPLCKNSMSYRDVDVNINVDPYRFSSNVRTHLTFHEGNLGYSDKITICLETEEVEREIKQLDIKADTGTQSALHSLYFHPFTAGDKYLGLGMECRKCYDYNYMIQIIVDLAHLKIKRIVLNSESLSIRTSEGMYEIRNVYTTNETEYCFNINPSTSILNAGKRQKLPLIPLNRDDPKKTLKRIKNLLIFT